ncbi:amidohydrolase [Klebsiella pneumoniae]|uniref:amidohydrolase n=1 Tax=Klebsiella pneumoniae TaxID=573 RepID=UPI002405006C|nr:amidohydrolase [Klebsiella pneumoniae]
MSSKYRTTLNVKRLTEFRHDLHMHPELKFMEHRTSDKIAAFLTELDIPYKRGLASTGIVGSIYGKNRSANDPGPALGIRADIDALPLEEANKFTHASKHKGCMHGCGHDGHTAMLLGAAELLSANRDFDGTIHLIFQPGEEGGAGARVMMNEGLFKLFPCQAVFALHNWPHLPQGQMGTKIGPIMASGVTFEITVFGKGGHAALPQSTIDPVPVACFIVSHLQTLISRRMNPLDAAVLTIGKIEAGSSPNIIPSLLGTRILLGIGEGLYYPMQNTIIKNWFPAGERGRANTAWILGQSLAPALAMPLYTWIIAEHSWRHTFYFSFSLTLLPIVLIYFFTSNFPQENKYVNVLELQKINKSTTEEVLHKNSSEKISVVERAKVYLCNSNFWILLAVFSSNSMLSWGVVTWLPTYLNTERGFSWANVGWMSALPFIFGLLFKVLAGFIVDKTDRKGMVMFVSAMLCAASILTGVNISNNFFAAIVISFGIGASSMQLPCVFTLLQSMVPAEAMSSAAGALNGMAVGFGALSPVLIGFILSVTHNFYFVMYILIGIVVIGGLFSLLFSRDRSRLLN